MNYEDKIFKKSNLEENDSISSYDGWAAQQNPNTFEVFHNFIGNVKPKRILEVGTALGGLTRFIKYTCDILDLDCHVLSYDIIDHSWYQELKDSGIDMRIENIFNGDYSEVKQEVIDFIQQEGTTIILCDGGSKIHEFKLLSNYVKSGDFIMAHDYAENREVFENQIYLKVWNWHEISDSDIRQSCEENNLEIFDKETFENVAWTCRKKL
jgi:cephalosporin hydroxylase